MVLLMIPLVASDAYTSPVAYCDSDTDANVLHDESSHVSSHLLYFDLRYSVVPLIVPLASHNTSTDAIGATLVKNPCYTSF